VAFGTSSLGDPVSPATQHPWNAASLVLMNEYRPVVPWALSTLIIGFIGTAAGTVWTAFTPVGTGVNFGAGVVLVLGLLVGVVGVILGCVALLGFRRAARSSR